MYPFYLELELVKPVSDYFKKQGYKVKDEVVAVELKLKDWKKAVVQAKNYKLAVDYVYLAVPLFRVYNILRKAEHILKKEGIGLLIVKETNCAVCKIIDAKQSKIKTCNITMEEIRKRRNLNKRPYYL